MQNIFYGFVIDLPEASIQFSFAP